MLMSREEISVDRLSSFDSEIVKVSVTIAAVLTRLFPDEGSWGECSEPCGSGRETRAVLCVVQVQTRWKVVGDAQCQANERPQDNRQCNADPCTPVWYTSSWSQVRVCVYVCESEKKRERERKKIRETRVSLPCSAQRRAVAASSGVR